MNAPNTRQRSGGWWRWPAAFALCLPFLILTGLSWVALPIGKGCLSGAEKLAALIQHLTGESDG